MWMHAVIDIEGLHFFFESNAWIDEKKERTKTHFKRHLINIKKKKEKTKESNEAKLNKFHIRSTRFFFIIHEFMSSHRVYAMDVRR